MQQEERAARLAELLNATHPETRARAGAAEVLPVRAELAGVLPDGGLRAGAVTEVADAGLLLALAGGVSAALPGTWAAAVGMPDLGLSAWASYGQDLGRAVLVDEPGAQLAEVLSAVIRAFDVVLVRPPGPPSAQMARRIGGLLRQHRCAVLTDVPWSGSAVRLEVESHGWSGLNAGWGMLQSRRVTVRAGGRGVWRPRTAELLLPDASGGVTLLEGSEAVLPAPEPTVELFDLAAQAF